MNQPRIIFMGTPDFSLPVLKMLIENYQVVMVVTQMDKPVGRKQILTPPPVKELAEKHHIKVFQPEKIRTDYQPILEMKPDIIITCAYGQIIPEEVLNTPTIGCFNVHASLLPKYRGGAPIHKAIINGDDKTGITIMYMDKGMDTGDIIEKEECKIEDFDTVGTLHDKLSIIGANLLKKVLPSIINGTNKREKQNENEVSYAYNIKREEEKIDFHQNGIDIINQIRGLNPWPKAYFLVNDEEWKILEAYYEKKNDTTPNKIREIKKDAIGIDCIDGTVYLTKIKPYGKKEMKVLDYLNGTEKKTVEDWKINE